MNGIDNPVADALLRMDINALKIDKAADFEDVSEAQADVCG